MKWVTLQGKEYVCVDAQAKHLVHEMQIYMLNSQFKKHANRSVALLLGKTQLVFCLGGINISHFMIVMMSKPFQIFFLKKQEKSLKSAGAQASKDQTEACYFLTDFRSDLWGGNWELDFHATAKLHEAAESNVNYVSIVK